MTRQERRKLARQAPKVPKGDLWARIAEAVDRDGFMAGINRTSKRIKANGEHFTPTPLVLDVLKNMDIEALKPGKTVLDPACGDGQFLVAVKWLKVLHFGMTEADAVNDLYGVDIQRDNVDRCIQRLGGGHILMGDTLNPTRKLEGQTDGERFAMALLFVKPDQFITKDGHSIGVYNSPDGDMVIIDPEVALKLLQAGTLDAGNIKSLANGRQAA